VIEDGKYFVGYQNACETPMYFFAQPRIQQKCAYMSCARQMTLKNVQVVINWASGLIVVKRLLLLISSTCQVGSALQNLRGLYVIGLWTSKKMDEEEDDGDNLKSNLLPNSLEDLRKQFQHTAVELSPSISISSPSLKLPSSFDTTPRKKYL
jgi:hypothetical protein